MVQSACAVEGSPVNPPPCTDTADLDDDVRDFLPVTFSHPVDGETLAVGDFEVVLGTIDGTAQETVTPGCATLAPALEADEMQTVLLVGDFTPAGSPALGPVTVNVVGDLNVLVEGAPENVNGLCAPPSPTLHVQSLRPASARDAERVVSGTFRRRRGLFCSKRLGPAS